MDWAKVTTKTMGERVIMNAERREIKRSRPRDLTFVAVRSKSAKLGKLLDISREGLCFQYMAESGVQGDQGQNMTPLEIDMFLSNKRYHLTNLPCKLVYDTETAEGTTFLIGLEYRRCGLKFGKLIEKQTDQLKLYLKSHAG